jgi:hypothetical protein
MDFEEVLSVESQYSPGTLIGKINYQIIRVAPVGVASFIGGEHVETQKTQVVHYLEVKVFVSVQFGHGVHTASFSMISVSISVLFVR